MDQLTTVHVFGLYHTKEPLRTYVFDDFGNAIWLNGDMFMQAIDFIITASYGYCH